ncbi:hypothetical protein D3C71_1754020 [compost metagenome]
MKAIGTKPSEATRAVINTGRRRPNAPSRTATSSGLPISRRWRTKLIITSPLSTATPDNAMKPTPAEIDKGMPRAANASTPPVSASGTPLNTMAASRAEPNAQNSSAKINNNVTGTTTARRWLAEISCSKLPPYSTQ